MKSTYKIAGMLTIATILSFTVVSMSLTEADAQRSRGDRNQEASQDCRAGGVVAACVGGVNVNAEVVCSVGVVARLC
jgi:hypothetical protein